MQNLGVYKSVNLDPCIFGQLTKFYYLCIVNQRKGKTPMASAKNFVGLPKKIRRRASKLQPASPRPSPSEGRNERQ